MLELMFITNDEKVACIAEKAGVQIIFVDLEYIGKDERQHGMDTVKSRHTIEDIRKIRNVLKKSKLLVRCNPIHSASNDYCSSEDEIKQILWEKPDIIMLPYFKTLEEVKKFLKLVNNQCQTMLLLETAESLTILDEILALDGIDYIHIGLNDLSISLKKGFLFNLLADGTVDDIVSKIRKTNISYGFGGIASLRKGIVPSELVISEHYRLGSSRAILSRSFCNVVNYKNYDLLEIDFLKKIKEIRKYEKNFNFITPCDNREKIKQIIKTYFEITI